MCIRDRGYPAGCYRPPLRYAGGRDRSGRQGQGHRHPDVLRHPVRRSPPQGRFHPGLRLSLIHIFDNDHLHRSPAFRGVIPQYKRQDGKVCGSGPVSYTHLDVYKRQALPFSSRLTPQNIMQWFMVLSRVSSRSALRCV